MSPSPPLAPSPGTGFNVNVPWLERGMRDADYKVRGWGTTGVDKGGVLRVWRCSAGVDKARFPPAVDGVQDCRGHSGTATGV